MCIVERMFESMRVPSWADLMDVDAYDDIDVEPDFDPTAEPDPSAAADDAASYAAGLAVWPLMPLFDAKDTVVEVDRILGRLPTADSMLSALGMVHQRIASLQYAAARLSADVAEAMPWDGEWAREEIAAALRTSSYTTDEMLLLGRSVRGPMRSVGAALAAGEISCLHAVRIVDGLSRAALDDDTTSRLAAELVDEARTCTPGQLRRKVSRAVIEAAPDQAAAAAKETKKDRQVSIYPGPASSQNLLAQGPAAEVQLIWTALDVCAGRTGAADDRGIDARRFDTLVEWARQALADPAAPRRKGRPVQVNVTMTLGTAFGLANTSADLHGYGPIPADVARELGRDATWRAFIVDAATGALDGLGTASYTPTARINAFIDARSQTCIHPACFQPAGRTDTEHAIPWPNGPTCTCNLGPECRRHHRCKHHGGWTVTQDPDGTRHWTSALGRTYVTKPHQYPVD